MSAVILVVLLGICGFYVFTDRVADEVREGSKYQVNVMYRVEGSARSVGITYTVGVAHTATDTAASLPWTKNVATGGTVSLIARSDQSGGTITCTVFANGKRIAEQTATGPLGTASCSGDAGLLPER